MELIDDKQDIYRFGAIGLCIIILLLTCSGGTISNGPEAVLKKQIFG